MSKHHHHADKDHKAPKTADKFELKDFTVKKDDKAKEGDKEAGKEETGVFYPHTSDPSKSTMQHLNETIEIHAPTSPSSDNSIAALNAEDKKPEDAAQPEELLAEDKKADEVVNPAAITTNTPADEIKPEMVESPNTDNKAKAKAVSKKGEGWT